MKYWTLTEIKTKIQQETDTEGELFVQDSELTSYINDAIDLVEAEVHGMYQDYFLTKDTMTLVNGQEEYDMPSDIYANKFRRIVYHNGERLFTIRRLRDWKKFEDYQSEQQDPSSDLYWYMILNETAGSPKLLLVPAAREDGAYVIRWYLRNANRLSSDSDVCDIPEFIQVIIRYVNMRIEGKEGSPNYRMSSEELQELRSLMRDTLNNMVPDADNEVEMDLSFYEEFE